MNQVTATGISGSGGPRMSHAKTRRIVPTVSHRTCCKQYAGGLLGFAHALDSTVCDSQLAPTGCRMR